MYSLDINFLKERNVAEIDKTLITTKTLSLSLQKQLPIIVGGGVMILLPTITAASLLLLNHLSAQTEQKVQELEGELGQLNSQSKSVEEVETKVKQNDQEIQYLVSVFNQIKPWSAIFQEIENQIPENVQVGSIRQDGLTLTIAGYALDYEDLNDFLLTLQSSTLLQADKTIITEAVLSDLPVEASEPSEKVIVEFPKVVKYTITTQLTERPSSELVQKFASTGSVGLVTRIRTLKQKGAIKP